MTGLRTTLFLIPAAVFAATASSAFAAGDVKLLPAKDGTRLNLSATASVELANDEARVSFYALETAPTLAEATQKALKRVNTGLARIKTQGIDAQLETTGLSSSPVYNEPKKGEAAKIVAWQVRQNIMGKVKSVEDAARLAQTAADYFAFSGVQFSLSTKAQSAVQEKLMREAMADIRAQAAIVADELGGGDVRVVSVTFNRSSYNMGGVYKANTAMLARAAGEADEASAPLPLFEAGRSNVSRQVNVELVIAP